MPESQTEFTDETTTDIVSYEPPPPQPQYVDFSNQSNNRGCLYAFIGMGGCLAIVIVALGISVLLGITSINGIISGITGIFSGPPDTAQVASTQTVLTEIEPLGQLVSIKTQFAKADIRVSISQSTLNACGHSAQYVAQGTVEAGVDLSELRDDSVSYDAISDTYTITIPPPKMTGCRIDHIDQYNNSFTLCNVDFDAARRLAEHTAILDFSNDALEGGILEQAKPQAEAIVANLIRLATGSNVSIVYDESALPAHDLSCTPLAPDGWIYNADAGNWESSR